MIRINKISSWSDSGDQFILLSREEDLSRFLNTEEEISFVKERMEGNHKISLINRYHQRVFILHPITSGDDKVDESLEKIRKAASSLRKDFNDLKIYKLFLHADEMEKEQVEAVLEGIVLSHYQFLTYFREAEKKKNALETIEVFSSTLDEAGIGRLLAVLEGVCLSRDLINEPLSWLTAPRLSAEIEKMGKEAGFNVEVLEKKKIEALKMGGLLAVNKGSIDPPTFNILEHKPENAVNPKPYVLVGKGVVYDTGGLSLKPTPDSMDYMKSDMAGAAAVAGLIYAAAKSGLPVHIIGLIPATDNRPDGNAYVPGDVIKMYDGTTVEVLNTDAEGRMIMADALAWAKQYDPELVIDIATLTGAAWIAIGTQGLVGMGNAPASLMQKLVSSGYRVHERVAEFPFWDDYRELLKSDIADLKNIGGRLAGAITAGKFLEHFTDYPYIHLDIAGPAFLKKNDSYRSKGGTGVGVRLLYRFFSELAGEN